MENVPATRDALIKSFSEQSVNTFREGEISIYGGGLISDESIVKYSVKIRYAFPSLPSEFYAVLLEMVKEEGFTDARFHDAVHHVIKNCVYPTPTIAQFISFDKRIKLLNYDQYLKLCDEGMGSSYQAIKFKDRPMPVWIHVNDINQYNIKSEI